MIHKLSVAGCLLVLSFSLTSVQAGVSQDNIVRGQKVYKKSCSACHDSGNFGAPLLSDKSAWQKRIRQPRKRLMQHVIKGFRAMPARGGDTSLNVRNIGDAVDYMLFTILGLDEVIVDKSALKGDNKKLILPDSAKAPETPSAPKKSKQQSQEKAKPTVAEKDMSITEPTPTTASADAGSDKLELERADETDTAPAGVKEELARLTESGHIKESEIPNDKYGDDVRLGLKIFTQTAKYAGRYSGNDLSCSNCHLDQGRREHAAPMWGAIGMYPAYKSRNDRNNTLEDRIQQCFQFSLNGFAPSPDSPEIRALLSYIHFISRGVPIGFNMPGRGFPQVTKTGVDPSPSRGLKAYELHCKSCHQEDGAGQRNADGTYKTPPLWGRNAYNKAAGFNRTRLLAGFIKANMPLNNANLSDQEALDIAAYINQQIRPGDPRKGLFDTWFGD